MKSYYKTLTTGPLNESIESRVAMASLVVAVSAFSFAAPAAAQDASFDRGRERGWDRQTTAQWLDHQALRGGLHNAVQVECTDQTNRRDVILNGNRITSQITNFGSISSPGNTITDIVWNGLGYGYEFGPFVAAEIVDEGHRDPKSVQLTDTLGNPILDDQGNPIWVMRIVSDGLVSNGGEVSPDGSEFWGWQPTPCANAVGNFEGLEVVNPESDKIPTSDAPDDDLDGKPDSWPFAWFNEDIREYVWPGALRQGASNADKEGLYFMNDYGNREFQYWPFEQDSTLRGLGLEVETRLYQWANPLAEDVIFLIYKITNKSDKDLDKVIFGMWGDPHIGGPGDWPDDLAEFDREKNMVFAWDADGRSDIAGRVPGYFGYKFLESPGVGNEIINGVSLPGDGIDNDNDGLLDESWTDGIDNDGDWNPDTDDVGIDGVPGTGDVGEGDGVPTAGDQFDITKPGEPNFEFTDIDESDQIGLTSFASPAFAGNNISNDDRVWSLVQPGSFEQVPEEPGDYVFIYGSGSFALRAGETKRFSIALIVGENRSDLDLNAETAQQIYDVGYRFAKPPEKPMVTAVPGDRKVTLYWDARAEDSIDPLSNEADFEGYVIYRSTDHEFSDQRSITDINGSKFLFRPHETQQGVPAKFDLRNGITGPSAIPYPRRGVAYDLGNDTGLFHTFVDSNQVINGQRYFYSVAAYDRGFAGSDGTGFSGGIAPTENSSTITYDPTTDKYIFDTNTTSAIPGPRAAGFVPATLVEDGPLRLTGRGTGDVSVLIKDPTAVPAGGQYTLQFAGAGDQLTYSVTNDLPVSATVTAVLGKTSSLRRDNIVPSSFVLTNAGGATLTEGTDYVLNAEQGSVQVLGGGSVAEGETLTATFNYQPLAGSPYVANEESNLVFDGLHVFVDDEPLTIDNVDTGWAQGGRDIPYEVTVAKAGPGKIPQPYDYEIRFADSPQMDAVSSGLPLPFTIVNLSLGNEPIQAFAADINGNGSWDTSEAIVFIETINGAITATWQVALTNNGSTPGAGDVFLLSTRKPFNGEDSFQIRTVAGATDAELAAAELDEIYVVPNPYVVVNELEPRNPIARTERGERRLYFANVPDQCTIRIYTLAGELVDTIEHSDPTGTGRAYWDLRTKDNMNIAYGLYLFHVDSPYGTSTGKFAIIK